VERPGGGRGGHAVLKSGTTDGPPREENTRTPPSPTPRVTEGRVPETALAAEGQLTAYELQRLGEVAGDLTAAAPGSKFSFTVLVTAEGGPVDAAVIEALNAVLAQATGKLRFDP
jgi:hypothetical protein